MACGMHEASLLAAMRQAPKMTAFVPDDILQPQLRPGRIRVPETEGGNDADLPAPVGITEK